MRSLIKSVVLITLYLLSGVANADGTTLTCRVLNRDVGTVSTNTWRQFFESSEEKAKAAYMAYTQSVQEALKNSGVDLEKQKEIMQSFANTGKTRIDMWVNDMSMKLAEAKGVAAQVQAVSDEVLHQCFFDQVPGISQAEHDQMQACLDQRIHHNGVWAWDTEACQNVGQRVSDGLSKARTCISTQTAEKLAPIWKSSGLESAIAAVRQALPECSAN